MAAPAQQVQGKVLRIGIVQDGRIVQERLVKAGETVTVGESTKNTFVFPPSPLPKRHSLFVYKSGVYTLNFIDGMKGKISYKDSIVSLEKLRQSGEATKKGGGWLLPLTESNRGKISIKNITVLFQFVPPPPEPLKPVKMDFRPRLIEEDDPVFMGFLGLFTVISAVLMIYVYTAEPVERLSLDKIPDRFTQVIMAPDEPVEAPDLDELDSDLTTKVEKKEEKVEKSDAEAAETEPKTAEEKKVDEAQRRKEMEQKVAESSPLLAALMGTRGESASDMRVDDPFGETDGSFEDIDAALQKVSGVQVATEGGVAARGELGGSRDSVDIGDLAKASGGSANVGSGPAVKVEGKVATGSGENLTGEGDINSVASVVRKRSGQIKYCYDKQLKVNPSLSGRVEVSWTISRGRATSVSIFSNSTGDAELGNCIKTKVQVWKFPDETNGMEVIYPFVLTQ